MVLQAEKEGYAPSSSETSSTLETIFAGQRTQLVRFCTHLTGNPDVAEDLAQETLLEAWRNQQKFHSQDEWKSLVQEWLEGLQLIYRERTLTILLIAFALTNLGEGIFGVLLVVFVKQILFSGAIVYGSLLAVQAVGSLIGGVVIGQIGNRLPPLRLLGVGLFTFGFIDLLIIDLPLFVHGLLIVFLLFILVGLPGTASVVGLNASLQTLVEDKLRGRVFGALLTSGSLLTLIGMGLAGTLGDQLGPVLMLNGQGGMYVFSGLLVLLTLWKIMAGRQPAQEAESVKPIS